LDMIKCSHQELRYAFSKKKVVFTEWGEKQEKESRFPSSSYFFYINKHDIYPKFRLPIFQGLAAGMFNSDDYTRISPLTGKPRAWRTATEVLDMNISLGFHSPASHSTLKSVEDKDQLISIVEAWKNIDESILEKLNGRFRYPFYKRMELIEKLKLK